MASGLQVYAYPYSCLGPHHASQFVNVHIQYYLVYGVSEKPSRGGLSNKPKAF